MTDPEVLIKMAEHFSVAGNREDVASRLAAQGITADNATPERLAQFDQLHIGGLPVTAKLVRQAAIAANHVVLDAGCGMGGAARYMAQTIGCEVYGIDMAQSLLDSGELLNEMTGVSDRVHLGLGDVTDIDHPDGFFDVAWTQHAAQSVPDKEQFFAELYRTLKPGGRCVMHDFYRGPGEEIHYPSFLGDHSITFLIRDTAMRRLLEETGFELLFWEDTTAAARAENATIGTAAPASKSDDGLLDYESVGEEVAELAANSVRDFDSRSVGLFEAVLRKP